MILPDRRIRLASLLIIIVAFFCISVLIVKQRSSKKTLYFAARKLPHFVTVDIHGNKVDMQKLIGKPSLVLFLDPLDPDDLDLVDKVFRNWKDSSINIVIAAENYSRLLKSTRLDLNKAMIISSDLQNLMSVFRAPENASSYHLFEQNGSVVSNGTIRDSYERSISPNLLRLVHGVRFEMSDFIEKDAFVQNIHWLGQIEKEIRYNRRDLFIFSLLTKICDSCSGGSIIREFQRIHQARSEVIRVAIIVPPNFNDDDIVSLKKQLNIDFPIMIADSYLANKWIDLIDQFGENYLSDIAFAVSASGKILKVSDRQCNCLPLLFGSIDSLLFDNAR